MNDKGINNLLEKLNVNNTERINLTDNEIKYLRDLIHALRDLIHNMESSARIHGKIAKHKINSKGDK